MRSHDWIDERSLAFDRAVADHLQADPSGFERARAVLSGWLARRQPPHEPALLEWSEILERGSREEILTLLRSKDERACRLRQSSPFCGILSPNERLSIIHEYEKTRA